MTKVNCQQYILKNFTLHHSKIIIFPISSINAVVDEVDYRIMTSQNWFINRAIPEIESSCMMVWRDNQAWGNANAPPRALSAKVSL